MLRARLFSPGARAGPAHAARTDPDRALRPQRWDLTVTADDGVAYEQLIAAMDIALATGFHTLDVSGTAQ
jgi:hypothetical protein